MKLFNTSIHPLLSEQYRSGRKRYKISHACLLGVLVYSSPVYSGDSIEEAGDIIQLLVPATAFGITYLEGDEEGRWQFLKAGATTGLSVHALKNTVNKWRPNHSDSKSFPSGHTAAAFSGASFLQTRYGSHYGIPAYALAAFVGYSRIHAEKHYSDDVLAGASIAMLSNWFFTTPLDNGVKLAPVQMEDGYGVSLSYALDNPDKHSGISHSQPHYRFAFSFGSAKIHDNEVWSPKKTGSKLSLDEFDKHANPTSSSRVRFEYFPVAAHEFVLDINPLEMRDENTFDSSKQFQGQTYPANTQTLLEYNMSEIRGAYRYQLYNDHDHDIELKIGAGLAWQYTWVRLVSNTLDEKVKETDFVPYLSTQLNYLITPKMKVQLQVDGSLFSSNKMLDTELSGRYQLSPQWDIGLGIRQYERELDTRQIKNDYKEVDYFMTLGYSF